MSFSEFRGSEEFKEIRDASESSKESNADKASNNTERPETVETKPNEKTNEQRRNSLDALIALSRLNRRRYNEKVRGGVLRYPLEAMTEHTDYLQIDIERYVPIGSNYVNAPGDDNRYVTGNNFTNRAGRRSAQGLSTKPLVNDGTILLPIPSNLQDTNNVKYDASSLNGLQAVGASAVTELVGDFGPRMGELFDGAKRGQLMTDFMAAGMNKMKDVVSGVGNPGVALEFFNQQLAASALSLFGSQVTANQLFQRANGELINPHMELLFGGPTLRNFRFAFRLAPRNEREAEQVRLIIRAFKRNMAPKSQGGTIGSGSFFLKTPNVFKLRYRSGRKNHPFLNKFKQCFMTDMQTTYTGEGVYSTYEDGTPVSMTLDVAFKEIQPIYDVDYDNNPGTEAVGY
tara:strand:+ start:88 stop:1290 length:1203 start_codon:yes stop_codon:yes gene_type:complete